MDTNLLSNLSEDHDQTLPSTSADKPSENLQPSAKTKLIIADLGLRYRPANQADLESQAHLLALLAIDVADVEPIILDQAARQWAKNSPFLPKASDLRALAEKIVKRQTDDRRATTQGENPYDRANEKLRVGGSSHRWVNGSLMSITEPRRQRDGAERPDPRIPLSTDEIERIRNGDSIQRGVFEIGVNQGWIVLGSDGIYRDSANVWG